MNSLPTSGAIERKTLLVAEGGAEYRPTPTGDPIEAWIGLIKVVEALRSRWPLRPHAWRNAWRNDDLRL